MTTGDIFTGGTLDMATEPLAVTQLPALWRDYPVNKVLVAVSLVLMLVCLKDMLRLVPQLLYSLQRSSGSASFEHNVSLSRTRDAIAFACLPPFCLMADRYGIYSPEIFGSIPPGWTAPAVMAAFTVYMILRGLCFLSFRPRRLDSNSLSATRRSPHSFFILLCFTMLATIGTLSIFSVDDSVLRSVLTAEIGLAYLLSIVRSSQILGSSYSLLRTFSYLCGLEFLPSAILVASALVF